MKETSMTTIPELSGERADILELLRTRRAFLRQTVDGMSDEQAGSRPTVSALCLGGLIKHVAHTEDGWARFILEGPVALAGEKDWTEWGPQEWADRENEFAMVPGDTLAGLLAEYQQVADRTDALVVDLPDLDVSQPLPKAPWYEEDGRRSARQVFLHIATETAQHAGHADIIRESIDGAKTMG
jgi:hypothetical protein